MAINQRAFWGIETVDQSILEAVVAQNGRVPDLFVDPFSRADIGPSADEGFEVSGTPQTQSLLILIDRSINNLIAQKKTGQSNCPVNPSA